MKFSHFAAGTIAIVVALAVVFVLTLLVATSYFGQFMLEHENRMLMRTPIQERRVQDIEQRLDRLEADTIQTSFDIH